MPDTYVTESGVTSDHHDVVSKINTFLAANGWTVDYYGTDGADGYKLHVHKGSRYFIVKSTNANPATNYTQSTAKHIYFGGASGYNAGSAWNAQPGASPTPIMRDCGGPHTAYHLILNATKDILAVVVEISAGVFRHAVVGNLTGYGTLSGLNSLVLVDFNRYNYAATHGNNCPICSATATDLSSLLYHGTLQVDFDGNTGVWVPQGRYSTFTYKFIANGRTAGFGNTLFNCSPMTFNGATLLSPLTFFLYRPASSWWSPLGVLTGVAEITVANLDPGQVVTIGSQQWKCFPSHQKNSTESALYGYAYRIA